MRRVGSANASQLDEPIPEVGLYIGELTVWGRGVGRSALTQVLEWLAGEGYRRCWAGIQAANERSRSLFESAGFRRSGSELQERLRYERDLEGLSTSARGALDLSP